ncbi:MAG: VOC family protein [Deltaproteobacteria bacterium]|nr:VOC family protein [Deltaproteobacteria bacterium]
MFSVHHISLSVKNVTESVAFYTKLEFSKVLQWESENRDLTIVHMKLNGIFLELFCFKNKKDAHESTKFLETDLPRVGIKHFGLKVKSIEKAKEFVISNGLANSVNIKRGRTEIDYFFIKDPSGNFIEFVQDDRNF